MTHQFPSAWALTCPALEAQALAALAKLDPGWQAILPAREHVFRAFARVSPADCRVVILGQDPYPNRSDAMGLAFSVPEGVKLPRSLANIYKELEADLGMPPPASGNLLPWAAQGVLLANTALTVVEKNAGAHAKVWAAFTEQWIRTLGNDGRPRVWVLWGGHAQKFRHLLGADQIVIESAHPSPLSARRGFFGSRPFSKINGTLSQLGYQSIRWV